MLSKMLLHGLIAAAIIAGSASVYAAAFAPDQGLTALVAMLDEHGDD
jgi:hypothetical protein